VTPGGDTRPIYEIKADLFRALGHPARIRALEVLAEGERSVGDLQPLVGIESSHLSQQLGVLRRAGLVTTRREGPSVIYAIRDPEMIELLAVAKRMLITSLSRSQDLLADLRTEAPRG
jgi:ArsR family transcriptional regulator